MDDKASETSKVYKEKKFVISQLLKEVKHKQPSTRSNKVSYTIT